MQVWCNLIILGERSRKKFPYSIFVVIFFILLVCLFVCSVSHWKALSLFRKLKDKKKTKKRRGHPKTFLFFDSLCSLIQKTSNTDSAGVIVPENFWLYSSTFTSIWEIRLNKIHSGKRLRRNLSDEKPPLSIHLRRYGRRDNRWPQGR